MDDVRVLPLLPNISGVAYQANLTMNLVALGFQPGTIPGFTNTFLGPFNNFDARLLLTQKLFDLSAIRNFQAGRAGVRVAELHEALAREQVASRTGLIYLEALRADRSVVAAQANVDLAEALLKLAQDQRNAGVGTGVDVTRAQTRLAEQQVGLAQAQTTSEQARLNLQRVVGLPLGGALVLTDQLRFVEDPLPSVDTAVTQAARDRREIQVAEEENHVSQLEAQAARHRHTTQRADRQRHRHLQSDEKCRWEFRHRCGDDDARAWSAVASSCDGVHLTPYDPVFQQHVSQMVTSMTAQQAYAAIYQTLVRQATLLAYIDNFRLLAFLCLICTPAALLFKKVRSRGRVCCNALMVTRMDADCLRIRIQSASSVANLFLSQ